MWGDGGCIRIGGVCVGLRETEADGFRWVCLNIYLLRRIIVLLKGGGVIVV